MAKSSLPPAPHDGSTGNVITRAEPKVKAASIAALLTPLALYYLYRYVPGVSGLPHELDVIVATLVTGGATFTAGFAARAVDRIDLFAQPYAAKVQAAADRTFGAKAVDDVEAFVDDLARPVKTAVVDAVHSVEQAASAGHDPLAAAEDRLPAVVDAVTTAVADGRSEAAEVLAPVVAQAAVDVPALAAEASAAPSSPKTADELMAELRKMLDSLKADETPIADQAQAAAAQPASSPAAPGPVPADPPTAPMAAVTAN